MDRIDPIFIKKLQGKHLLIVEDYAIFLNLLAGCLTEYGIRVSYAQSGNKALSEIEQHGPDIILLDLELSDINGLDLATLLRQSDQTKDTPILFMSGAPEHEVGCLKIPAAGFIWKPFELSELLAKLASL
jgi:DNA-binding response OmpR family regulator